MVDRIAGDHPSVETLRARLVETATTVRLVFPREATTHVSAGEVLRVVLDGTDRHALVRNPLGSDGGVWIGGVYDAPRLARSPGDARNRLPEWCSNHDLEAGRSVLVDVLQADFRIGLRAPGERVVYDVLDRPSESLAAIARRLEE